MSDLTVAVEGMAEPRLTVELVPETCWYSNVRSNVSSEDWDRCKRFVRRRSGDRCEICGGRGPKWPVECHEVWTYEVNTEGRVQRLDGLIALCPSCHEVKHIGRAELVGNGERALEHLAAVNDWPVWYAALYVKAAASLWRERSRYHWQLDISYLDEVLG